MSLPAQNTNMQCKFKMFEKFLFFTKRAGSLVLVQNAHRTNSHLRTKFGWNPFIIDFLGALPKNFRKFFNEGVFSQSGLDTERLTSDIVE